MGNLPYYVSSQILFQFTAEPSPVRTLVFTRTPGAAIDTDDDTLAASVSASDAARRRRVVIALLC